MSAPVIPTSEPKSEALLEFRDVTRIYGSGEGEVRALAGASFEIQPGEFVAMMGPSGSGKSTTMNILGCLDTPSGGAYLFRGVNVGALDRKQRARLRRYYLGFVFQGFNLLARTNAVENVELPLIYRGTKRSERRERAHGHSNWLVSKSGGITRRQNSPEGSSSAWRLPEPWSRTRRFCWQTSLTGNLDSARSQEIMDLLCRLNREEHLTIAMVTHEPDMAAYASRTIHFRDGLVHSDSQNHVTSTAGETVNSLGESGRGQ